MEIIHKEIAYKIVGCGYTVYNELGYGLLEKVYENALCVAFDEAGLRHKIQHPIQISFHGANIGSYFADILVEDKIIVELKSCKTIIHEHEAQLLNYLTATNLSLGIIINFAPEQLEYKRLVK